MNELLQFCQNLCWTTWVSYFNFVKNCTKSQDNDTQPFLEENLSLYSCKITMYNFPGHFDFVFMQYSIVLFPWSAHSTSHKIWECIVLCVWWSSKAQDFIVWNVSSEHFTTSCLVKVTKLVNSMIGILLDCALWSIKANSFLFNWSLPMACPCKCYTSKLST